MKQTLIYQNTYQFDEEGVRFFLLIGTERALLIDSGMTTHNALDIAKEITNLPVSLFNTHADPDHTGSNSQFEKIMINPAELVNFRAAVPSDSIIPVYDGDIIDLGGRRLKAIHIPGHTPGSTAILDIESRTLFSGDTVQNGRIFMFGPMRSMTAFIHSLNRLISMSSEFDTVYPCHGDCPVSPDIISKLSADAQEIENGSSDFKLVNIFGNDVRAYNTGNAVFLCNSK